MTKDEQLTNPTRPVLQAFPEYSDRLRALAEHDPAIGELCDEFDIVIDAHRRSLEGDQPSVARAREYHGLRLELEAELLDRLREESVQ